MRRRLKDFSRFSISLILMFSLLLVQLSLFTNKVVLNSDFYKSKLNNGNYYSLLRQEINFSYKNLSMITSVPEKIFTDSINDTTIKKISEANIYSTVQYMKSKSVYTSDIIDTKLLSNNIQTDVKSYALKNNITIDSQLTKQISQVSDDAEKIVANHAALFNISEVSKYSEFQSFRNILYRLYNNTPVFILLTFFLILVLLLLNLKRKRRTLLWVGSSLIPASVITLVPSLLAHFYKLSGKIAIDTPYLKNAISSIFSGYINYFIISGFIYLSLGALCLYLYSLLSNRAAIERQSK